MVGCARSLGIQYCTETGACTGAINDIYEVLLGTTSRKTNAYQVALRGWKRCSNNTNTIPASGAVESKSTESRPDNFYGVMPPPGI